MRCSINRGLKLSTCSASYGRHLLSYFEFAFILPRWKNPTCQSQMFLPQPRFLPLPPELILVIIQLLSHKDQQTFCLLLSAVFRKLVYSRNVGLTLRGSTRRGEMLKQPSSSSDNSYQPFCYDIDPWLLVHLPWIRELALHDRSYGDCDYESILFPYLRSLPNLQSFTFSHFHRSPGFLQLSPPYRTALLSTSHIGLNFPLFQRNA